MFKRLNGNIIIALCTACAMIAFAFYERYEVAGPERPRARFTSPPPAICHATGLVRPIPPQGLQK